MESKRIKDNEKKHKLMGNAMQIYYRLDKLEIRGGKIQPKQVQSREKGRIMNQQNLTSDTSCPTNPPEKRRRKAGALFLLRSPVGIIQTNATGPKIKWCLYVNPAVRFHYELLSSAPSASGPLALLHRQIIITPLHLTMMRQTAKLAPVVAQGLSRVRRRNASGRVQGRL
jgi:hypothetical protein